MPTINVNRVRVFMQSLTRVMTSRTRTRTLFSPEEVFLAIDFVALRETLVVEVRLTVGALETLRVPAALQDLQDEPVQDGFVAARTLGNGRCGRRIRNCYLKSNTIVNMTL